VSPNRPAEAPAAALLGVDLTPLAHLADPWALSRFAASYSQRVRCGSMGGRASAVECDVTMREIAQVARGLRGWWRFEHLERHSPLVQEALERACARTGAAAATATAEGYVHGAGVRAPAVPQPTTSLHVQIAGRRRVTAVSSVPEPGDGVRWELRPGDVAVLPPRWSHRTAAVTPSFSLVLTLPAASTALAADLATADLATA
jgi:hypothetical protein